MRALLLAAGSVLAGSAGADGGVERGYAEARVARFEGVPGTDWQTVERVRPTFTAAPRDRLRAVLTLEAALTQGRDATAGDGIWDTLDVDRLFLDAYGGSLDARVGRQALHWGSAQFFNPTDPFPEVLIAEPWRPRRGVNAARILFAPMERADATGVVLLDDDFAHPQSAVRLRGNAAGTDAALVGAWRGGSDWLVGADLKGTLEVGWWVEAAARSGASGAQLAAGLDYSFPVLERVVPMVQVQRDAPLPASLGRGVRNSLLAVLAVQATPDFALTAATLTDLDGGASAALPSASWAATDWLEVAASAAIVLDRNAPTVLTAWIRASF